VAYF